MILSREMIHYLDCINRNHNEWIKIFFILTYCGKGFGNVTLLASALIFIPDLRIGHKQIKSRWAINNRNISCCCCISSSLIPVLFLTLTRWSRDWQPWKMIEIIHSYTNIIVTVDWIVSVWLQIYFVLTLSLGGSGENLFTATWQQG